jgi:hypothetical protein
MRAAAKSKPIATEIHSAIAPITIGLRIGWSYGAGFRSMRAVLARGW